jgi:hypothetical protein
MCAVGNAKDGSAQDNPFHAHGLVLARHRAALACKPKLTRSF